MSKLDGVWRRASGRSRCTPGTTVTPSASLWLSMIRVLEAVDDVKIFLRQTRGPFWRPNSTAETKVVDVGRVCASNDQRRRAVIRMRPAWRPRRELRRGALERSPSTWCARAATVRTVDRVVLSPMKLSSRLESANRLGRRMGRSARAVEREPNWSAWASSAPRQSLEGGQALSLQLVGVRRPSGRVVQAGRSSVGGAAASVPRATRGWRWRGRRARRDGGRRSGRRRRWTAKGSRSPKAGTEPR